MIIFLDFDGVLHPNNGRLFSCAPCLWQIMRRHPDVSVVFSTGWRFEHTLDSLRFLACANGGEDLAGRFIDATPLLKHEKEAGSREKDCLAWLRSRDCVTPWLALDDMPSLFTLNSPSLYSVNPKRGLMYYDIERISLRI